MRERKCIARPKLFFSRFECARLHSHCTTHLALPVVRLERGRLVHQRDLMHGVRSNVCYNYVRLGNSNAQRDREIEKMFFILLLRSMFSVTMHAKNYFTF